MPKKTLQRVRHVNFAPRPSAGSTSTSSTPPPLTSTWSPTPGSNAISAITTFRPRTTWSATSSWRTSQSRRSRRPIEFFALFATSRSTRQVSAAYSLAFAIRAKSHLLSHRIIFRKCTVLNHALQLVIFSF